MNFIAVIALVAVFASQSGALFQTTEICTAYFKAIGVVTDPSTLPVGQMWEDKVCVQDPSFYLSCKLFNGVISGELQQCPPGKLFDQNAMKPWDKICVPASECQMKKCPDWIQKMALMKSSTEVVNRITHGSHGCIDCVIGECHQCLCRDALKWSFNGVATVVDPNCGKPGHLARDCRDEPSGGGRGGGGGGGGGFGGRPDNRTCYKCQQTGHIARDCTNE